MLLAARPRTLTGERREIVDDISSCRSGFPGSRLGRRQAGRGQQKEKQTGHPCGVHGAVRLRQNLSFAALNMKSGSRTHEYPTQQW
jgi:hypothetical protein